MLAWQSVKYLGDLEKCVQRFGETCSAKYVGDLEKRVRKFGETCSVKYVGDLEKRGRRVYGDHVLDFVKE